MSTVPTPPATDRHAKAVRTLSRKCDVMKRLIARVGPCTWAPVSDDPFTVLVRCVIYQQISTKAAKSIFERLTQAAGGVPVDCGRLAAFTEAEFRACGVSAPKQRTLLGLTGHIAANPGLLPGIEDRDEAVLRAQLTAVKGIGPWSVDMFLMFGLCRPDVLPVGDLGLRAGVRDEFGLKELPNPKELEKLAERWRPYRSIATWYLWRSRGFVPQSGQGG